MDKKTTPWASLPRDRAVAAEYPVSEKEAGASRVKRYPPSLPVPLPDFDARLNPTEALRTMRALKRAGYNINKPYLLVCLLAWGKATMYQIWWELSGIRTRTPTYVEIQQIHLLIYALEADKLVDCERRGRAGRGGKGIKTYIYPTEKAQAFLDSFEYP